MLERIDYDAHGKIKFNTDDALFGDGPGALPGDLLPPRPLLPDAGAHACARAAAATAAREIVYDEPYFDMPADSPARKLPERRRLRRLPLPGKPPRRPEGKLDWQTNDWVAFLGASYFRAIGELYQYGLSARGIALDAAVAGQAEEFPDFTHFYFEPPRAGVEHVDGLRAARRPRASPAPISFVMQRGKGVLMDIETRAVPAPRRRAASASRR